VEDGVERPISSRRWPLGGQVAWLSNGGGLVFIASEQAGGLSQIWHVSYPGGEVQKITNDPNNYIGVSLTADSNALVTAQSDLGANIWISSREQINDATQITSAKLIGAEGLAWVPDGRLIYTSTSGGDSDLLISDAKGDNQKQLMLGAGKNRYPAVSPDGRYVFFSSTRTGAPHIWRMSLDGSNLKQLTNGGGENRPTCSRDSQWVIYSDAATNSLWKVPAEGGNPVPATDKLASRPQISPDGRSIVCRYREAPLSPFRIGILSLETGSPTRLLDLPSSFEPSSFPFGGLLRWTPGGRGIAYVVTRAGVSNIWEQPLDGGQPKQITNFKSGQIFFFDWSQDGKQLALSRGFVSSDVVLISELK
jgi:Tol biopolymer transport system component